MNSFVERIHSEYKILYELGFVDELVNCEKGFLFSYIDCLNPSSGLIFSFILEKGIITVHITTRTILECNFLCKYYDFFYVLKLLYPSKDFFELETLSCPDVIAEEIERITDLFNDKNVSETIQQLILLQKEYSKVRWKNRSRFSK